jgi:hypothetical protein
MRIAEQVADPPTSGFHQACFLIFIFPLDAYRLLRNPTRIKPDKFCKDSIVKKSSRNVPLKVVFLSSRCEGLCLALNPLDPDCWWVCNKCGTQTSQAKLFKCKNESSSVVFGTFSSTTSRQEKRVFTKKLKGGRQILFSCGKGNFE